MKTLILLIFLFAAIKSISAQVSQEWVTRYNGPGNSQEGATSIFVDDLENVYVTGTGFKTIKYNSAGNQQWAVGYDITGNNIDAASSIKVDSYGNIYVTGYSNGIGTESDYATIKYNSEGIQQWVARYNGPGNFFDDATSLTIDDVGNVYVTGVSYDNDTSSDYVTIKYNSFGIQQWLARYNGSGNSKDGASSIVSDNSGNVYVTGVSRGISTFDDYATLKYNSDGVLQWVVRYNGPGNDDDLPNSITLDNSGNVYVTGVSEGNEQFFDYATIKYNSAGVEQWVSRYNGTGNSDDQARSIVVDNMENVYVTGFSKGIGTNYDYATIKYNSAGVEQWITRFNGKINSEDLAYSIAVDDSKNVYVSGFSTNSNTFSDYTTIKYNSSGIQQWIEIYNGPGNLRDETYSMFLDKTGNVYVTGFSVGIETGSDFATIKYSQTTGITQTSSVIPDQFSLSQNYPNPFNPETNLEFGISKLGFVSLKIYNVLGNEVKTLVSSDLRPGTYKYEFDASDLPSGTYFYKLSANGFVETKKMLLLK